MTATGQESDAALAGRLAEAAGALLLTVRAAESTGELGARGDRAAHEFLARELRDHRPRDVVFSEEGLDDHRRLGADRVWIVDPLDGTREFAEPGRTDWAVHVALWSADAGTDADTNTDTDAATGRLVAGAVALPALGRTYATDPPPPTLTEPQPVPKLITVSRTRPPSVAQRVAAELDAELVPMGSAGAKVMAVVRGEVDAYLHAGGQYEWDSAAPVAVARAAGLHASRLNGAELLYNRPDPRLPDLLVCRPEHAATLLAAIAGSEARS
ncbi:3'(2'),5'-bisphosphate nucleotidase CysQ [Pseudonocardia acaciae]|uniref:3'(2'),5'-bisphosphate nucleotidase CysQ n=1 Tax=Pseudonocardia acaciae TaxID=551276 RepID=UPI00048FF9A2|nr:3'(2'),5'-bisphosphate nucleotidase CysQ [Pseudonocardia acaciae]